MAALNGPFRRGDSVRWRRVFLIAGEPSGDALGGELMRSLRDDTGEGAADIRFAGVGGVAMQAAGLQSMVPLDTLAVMGIVPVLKRLPYLLRCIRVVAEAVVAAKPDILILIDSPDLTHRIARIVRRRSPEIPIVDYVSPTVWAWRPGRARRMRSYVDHVLALLPFEPAAYERLHGPACTYVGHPLLRHFGAENVNAAGASTNDRIVVMPGSRESEVWRLMPIFGAALARLQRERPTSSAPLEIVLPTLPHLRSLVHTLALLWPIRPCIVVGEEQKRAAIRGARAALVASGTATLEVALAGVPMVVAYRVSLLEECVARMLVGIDYIALPNLILGREAIPERLQRACNPLALAGALAPLLADTPHRRAQISALAEMAGIMRAEVSVSPSQEAARIIHQIVASCRTVAASRQIRL